MSKLTSQNVHYKKKVLDSVGVDIPVMRHVTVAANNV